MEEFKNEQYGTSTKSFLIEQSGGACPWTPDMSGSFPGAYPNFCSNTQFQGFGGGDPITPPCNYIGEYDLTSYPSWAFGPPFGLCSDQTKPCIVYDTNADNFRIHDPTNTMGTNPCDTGCDWNTVLDTQGKLSFLAYECDGNGTCNQRCDGTHGTDIYNTQGDCTLACANQIPDQLIGCTDSLATNYGSGSGGPGVQYGVCVINGVVDPTACVGCDYDPSCPGGICNSGTAQAGNDACCTYSAGACLDSRFVQDGTGTSGTGSYIASDSEWDLGGAGPGGYTTDCGQVTTPTIQLQTGAAAPWYGFPVTTPVDLGCCTYPASQYIGCMNPAAGAAYDPLHMFDCSAVPVQYKDESGNPISDPLGQTPDNDAGNGYGDESCCGWVYGCTDPIACNYNTSANQDDGSCIYYGCGGCTNPVALDYDPAALLPCNSTGNPADENDCCSISALGCPEPTAMNYNPATTIGCSPVDLVNTTTSYLVNGNDWNNDNTLHTGTFPIQLNPGGPTTPYTQWPSYSIATTGPVGYPITIVGPDCVADPTNMRCDCCVFPVNGCTDNQALNYNASANTDDGSCEYDGCPDQTANNYWLNGYTPWNSVDNVALTTYAGAGCTVNGTWTLNDATPVQSGGCCVFPLAGCMDSTACNYSQYATSDDGSCCYSSPCEGCANPNAINYDPNACIVNQTLCIVPGCIDTGNVTDPNGTVVSPFPGVMAANYNQFLQADCNEDDHQDPNYNPQTGWNSCCEYAGCTDPDAVNYDSEYDGCGGPATNYVLDPQSIDCCTYRVGCTDTEAINFTDPSGLTPPYLIPCNESTVPQEPHLQVAYGSSTLLLVNGDDYLDTIGDAAWDSADNNDCCEIVPGCMDPLANNYNYQASQDDNSCEYLIGCTESGYSNTITSGCCGAASATAIACNSGGDTTGNFAPDGDEVGYLPSHANYNNATHNDCCVIEGCMDQGTDPATLTGQYNTYLGQMGALNYDPNATVSNGSCSYLTYGCSDVLGGAISTVPGSAGCIDQNFYNGSATFNTEASNPYVVSVDTTDIHWCCEYPDTDNYVICEGNWNGNTNTLDSPSPGNPGWGSCSSSLDALNVDVQTRLSLQSQYGIQLVWSSADGVQVEYPTGSGIMVDQAYADCMNDGCGDCEQIAAEGCVWCEVGAASDTCGSSQSISIVADAYEEVANGGTKFFNTLSACQGDTACYQEMFGCTDPNYCEYYTQALWDPFNALWTNAATDNDGSCATPIQYGCTDPLSSGGGTGNVGNCTNPNPDPNDPNDTTYDPYDVTSGVTDATMNYGNVYAGNGTAIPVSAPTLGGAIEFPINWIDTGITPAFVAAGNADCEYDCEDANWGTTVPESFLQVYAKMAAPNPSTNFGNNNSCFACDGATCQEFGPGDEAALDTFIINMWAGGWNPVPVTFFNTLTECDTNNVNCGQASYCADDGSGTDPIYDTVRATANPVGGGTAWPSGTPACNYDASTATPGLSCPCQGGGGNASPECCCEYTSCLACADPTALNEGERCDQTQSASSWLVQDECAGGTGSGNVLLGGTDPCCYVAGCTDPTMGPNPDINGNDINGSPCTSPCTYGFAATNFDPDACQDDPSAPCEYNTDPDYDCIPPDGISGIPTTVGTSLCTEVPPGTGTYNTLNQCIASGCGADRWECVEYQRADRGPVRDEPNQLAEQPYPLSPLEPWQNVELQADEDKWVNNVSWVGTGPGTTFDCCEPDPLGPHISKQDCIDNSVCDDCEAVRWKCIVDPSAGTATGNNCVATVAADPDCIAGNCQMTENDCIQTGCENTDKKWVCTMDSGIVHGDFDHEKLPARKDMLGEQATTIPCVQSGYIGYDSQQDCHNATPCDDTIDPCFTPETLVTMADNTKKEISKIEVGEKVLNANGGTSEVIQVHVHECSYEIYGFNGGKAFITAEHPLLTDSGWKAVNPKETQAKHGVEAATLQVGDYLLKDNKEKVKIESIEKAEERVPKVYHISLYEIPTHYANDYIAHNGVSDPNKRALSIKGWEKELNDYYKINEQVLLSEDPSVPDPNDCPNKDEMPCPHGCNQGVCVPIAMAWCGSLMCPNDPTGPAGCEYFEGTTPTPSIWKTCSAGFKHGNNNGPCVLCCPGGTALGACLSSITPGQKINQERGMAPNGDCCIRQAYNNWYTPGGSASGGCHATDWVSGTYGTSDYCMPQVCYNDWTTTMPCNGFNPGSCGYVNCDPFPEVGPPGGDPTDGWDGGYEGGGSASPGPGEPPTGCVWCPLVENNYWGIFIDCLMLHIYGNVEEYSLVCHDIAVADTTGGYFAPLAGDDPLAFPDPAPSSCGYNANSPIVQQWWYPEDDADMPWNSTLDWEGECADLGFFGTNGFSGWWSQTPYPSGAFEINYTSSNMPPLSRDFQEKAISKAATEEQKNKLRTAFGLETKEPIKQPTKEPSREPTTTPAPTTPAPTTPAPIEPTTEPTTPETQELKEHMDRIKKLMGL